MNSHQRRKLRRATARNLRRIGVDLAVRGTDRMHATEIGFWPILSSGMQDFIEQLRELQPQHVIMLNRPERPSIDIPWNQGNMGATTPAFSWYRTAPDYRTEYELPRGGRWDRALPDDRHPFDAADALAFASAVALADHIGVVSVQNAVRYAMRWHRAGVWLASRAHERHQIRLGRYTAPGAQNFRPRPEVWTAATAHECAGLYRYRSDDLLKPCPDCDGGTLEMPATCAACDGWGVL